MNMFFKILFDVGFYCDIFSNIHATLLVSIVFIILITITVVVILSRYLGTFCSLK